MPKYVCMYHCISMLHFRQIAWKCFDFKMNPQEGLLKKTNSHHSKLVCVSSYVASKNLGDRKQSHIGCICLTFLHCAFPNVFPNDLPETRHSHIGCIYLIFLHCGFSNVSSNCLSSPLPIVFFAQTESNLLLAF